MTCLLTKEMVKYVLPKYKFALSSFKGTSENIPYTLSICSININIKIEVLGDFVPAMHSIQYLKPNSFYLILSLVITLLLPLMLLYA